jgi:hypothetical protein
VNQEIFHIGILADFEGLLGFSQDNFVFYNNQTYRADNFQLNEP